MQAQTAPAVAVRDRSLDAAEQLVTDEGARQRCVAHVTELESLGDGFARAAAPAAAEKKP